MLRSPCIVLLVGLIACTRAHSPGSGDGMGFAGHSDLRAPGRAASPGDGGGGSVMPEVGSTAGGSAPALGGTGSTRVSSTASATATSGAGAATPGSTDAGAPGERSRELCSFRTPVIGGGLVLDQPQKHHQSLVDSKGDVVLTGSFSGKLVVGSTTLVAGGQRDAFVIKLDRDCLPVWAKSFGGQAPGTLWFAAIARDAADGLYLAGGFSGKTDFGDPSAGAGGSSGYYGLLIKLDPDGATVWSKVYTSANAGVAVTDLVTDAAQRVTLVGYAGADTSFGGAPIGFLYAASMPFLAQLSTDGAFGWSRTFTSADLLYGLATGARDDGLVLTGWDGTQVDLGAGSLALGKGGRFLAKLDSHGAQQWLRALPHGADVDQWNWWKDGVVVDALGGIDVLRDEPQTLPGDSGARVIDDSVEQYASDGTPRWQRRSSDATDFDHEWGSALAVFSDRHVVRFGSFTGTTAYAGQTLVSRGGHDVALLELTADGDPVTVYVLGGALDDLVLGLTVDSSDHVFASYVGDETESGDAMDLVVTKLSR